MSRFSRTTFLRTALLSVGLLFATTQLDGQELLDQWKDRQRKIKRVIEKVSPCVVAIEGGCGVIVSEQGHVLTVSHVTGAAGRRVEVGLADGTVAMGTTLGSNPNLDVSALKLDEDRKWPHLTVPDLSIPAPEKKDFKPTKIQLAATRVRINLSTTSPTQSLEAGTWCLAFGYPLSFNRGQPAVVRLGQIGSVDTKQISTTAVIMGGDSGGPLVDLDGRLIGVSSRVKTEIDANLHVPVQVYRDQWEQLMAGIDVPPTPQDQTVQRALDRPWLGVFGDTDESRVRVRQVQMGSPAHKAGLRQEDVIVLFDNAEVTTFSQVVKRLKTLRPGDVVDLRVNRYGTMVELSVELGSKR